MENKCLKVWTYSSKLRLRNIQFLNPFTVEIHHCFQKCLVYGPVTCSDGRNVNAADFLKYVRNQICNKKILWSPCIIQWSKTRKALEFVWECMCVIYGTCYMLLSKFSTCVEINFKVALPLCGNMWMVLVKYKQTI